MLDVAGGVGVFLADVGLDTADGGEGVMCRLRSVSVR